MQSAWSDLNRRSPASKTGGFPGFPTRLNKHPAGVEPALPAWRAGRLPLHHGCQRSDRIVKELLREHRVGLEPTSPHYGCGVLAAERPVPVSQWDQTDLNRHLLGKESRRAGTAANTLIPRRSPLGWFRRSAWKESNLRRALIRSLL
jgi:hypothetical protein